MVASSLFSDIAPAGQDRRHAEYGRNTVSQAAPSPFLNYIKLHPSVDCYLSVALEYLDAPLREQEVPRRPLELLARLDGRLGRVVAAEVLHHAFSKILKINVENVYFCTEWMKWMSQRKRKETKQKPGTAGQGNILGCCLVSLCFLCHIHSIHSVQCKSRM